MLLGVGKEVRDPAPISQGRFFAVSTWTNKLLLALGPGTVGLELLSKPPPTLALCWHDDVFPAPPRPFDLLPRKFLSFTSSIPSITWPYFLSVDFETVHPSREPASNPISLPKQHPLRRPHNVWRSVSPLPSVNPTFYPSDEPFRCHGEPLHRAMAKDKYKQQRPQSCFWRSVYNAVMLCLGSMRNIKIAFDASIAFHPPSPFEITRD